MMPLSVRSGSDLSQSQQQNTDQTSGSLISISSQRQNVAIFTAALMKVRNANISGCLLSALLLCTHSCSGKQLVSG